MRISDWSSDVCSSDLDLAAEKLRRITLQCEAFRPRFVVPFASFVYFSHAENSYMNADINLPGTAAEHIAEHTDAVSVLLQPNETWHGHVPKNNASAIPWWPDKSEEEIGRASGRERVIANG